MRINGLVRIMNSVRKRIGNGLSPDGVEKEKKYIGETLKKVEEMCRGKGTTVDSLSTRSRNAYNYLKNIDWDSVQTVSQKDVNTKGVNWSFPGLSTKRKEIQKEVLEIETLFSDQTQKSDITQKTNRIHKKIVDTIKDIDDDIKEDGLTLNNFKEPSIKEYQWFKFLSKRDNFKQMLTAAHTMGNLLRSNGIQQQLNGKTVVYGFTNQSSTFRSRTRKGVVHLNMSLALIFAPQGVLKNILNLVTDPSYERRTSLKAHVERDEYNSIASQIKHIGMENSHGRGVAHDLDASFERVNKRFFNGKIKKPLLKWGKASTNTLACWVPSRSSIEYSITLDTNDVPTSVLDFVTYHEILHIDMGVVHKKGKYYAHTPAFRKRERQYPGYDEIDIFLKNLVESNQ